MTVHRFSTFEFDTSVPEIRDRGHRVHLQDMPLRVLEILLRAPGQVVTRESFFAELWPHDDSGVLDDNLNTAVRKLRLALDDSAHHPRFIETIPKHGYRFIAPVSDIGHKTAEVNDLAPVRGAGIALHNSRKAGFAFLAAAILIALAAVLGWPYFSNSVPDTASGMNITTVAILPFTNASGNPEDRYFSDGLTEEIMDQLSRSERLKVASRTSSFAVDAERLDAREIGQILGAEALVEGSVRRDKDRLRISVRLVDTNDGYQLWSETYDRRMVDVLAVQQDIARSIAATLTSSTEYEPATVPMTVDPVAFDHYLKGRYYWHRRSENGLLTAMDHFRIAVDVAPKYARAWAGLADAYAVLGFYDYLPPRVAFPQARDAASQALSIEPDNADAEAALGYVALYYDWNIPQAETHFVRSIRLRPESSKAHQWYANLLTAAGRFDEAEASMRRATQLDPLSLIASAALGWTRYYAGRHEEALEQYELTRELDENFELVYLWIGWAYEAMGDYDRALAMLKEARQRSGDTGITTAALARTLALSGAREQAEALLETLESSDGYVPAFEIAKARFALGQPTLGMEWLDRAYAERSHSLVFLRVDPQLASVRDAEVFVAFADRVLP